MQVAIIFESLTGNTRKVSQLIAQDLVAEGHLARAMPVDRVDLEFLQEADLVVLGTWVHGAFVVGASPAKFKLHAAPSMQGKKAVVFCTYALAAGKSLQKLTALAESLGLTVLGGLLVKRGHLQGGADRIVEALLSEAPASREAAAK